MTVDRYAEIHRAYRWQVPADFNIAVACCRRWAQDRSRFALYWEDESGERAAYTFWDLERAANRLSNALAARGIGRGDKIAIILPQRPETAIAHFAAYQLGAITVPLSFLFGPEALEYRLQDSECKVALVDVQSLPNLEPIRERVPRVEHVIAVGDARASFTTAWEDFVAECSAYFTPVATRADDAATLIYTSGTTGPPKGAVMPHRCLIGNLPGFVH